MTRLLPLLLLAPLLSAGSAPPAPITYTIHPGDTLQKYDGDLDRVEIVAVPGSRVLTVRRVWPIDDVPTWAVHMRERGDFKLSASDVTVPWEDGERLLLYRGPGWYLSERWSYSGPGLQFGEPLFWPTPEWEEVEPSQWWHGFTGNVYTITNGWEDLVFEGTGEVGLAWTEDVRFEAIHRPGQFREPPSLRVEADWALEVTYYPATP